MTQPTYVAPVDALLSLGKARVQKWPDYPEKFNLTTANVSELIRMATDADLNFADSDSLEGWAPIHAWRALGQLRAEAAIEPLLSIAEEMEESDWYREEMPEVFGIIGPAAIPSVSDFLADPNHTWSLRWMCADILVKIAQNHPASRDDCLARLVHQLEQYSKNNRELNGMVVSALMDIKGKEAAAVIESAFLAKRVDTSIPGDWIDVQYDLGLLTDDEVYDLRNHVDAENVGTKAMKLRESTAGFGGSTKTSRKGKKRS